MEQLTVGKKVYLKPAGNNARYGKKEPVESVIEKVGRKYFYVLPVDNERYAVKFYLSNLREVTDYSPGWEFYFSLQEILDDQERHKLSKEIHEIFDYHPRRRLTLDQLRRIKAIIDEGRGQGES